MDDIVFYQPPPASRSQSRFSETFTASHCSLKSTSSLSARQTATNVSTLPQRMHTSDRQYGSDKQEDSTASRILPNHSDDDFPPVEELWSGTRQKSLPASADLNGSDHNSFTNIDELLPEIQQKGPIYVDLDCGRMVDVTDNGTRSGSPVDSSRSTAGSSQDPFILGDSDDESPGADSETDYDNLDADLLTKSDSFPLIADNDVTDGKGFGSGATHVSDRVVADYPVDDRDSGLIDGARLNLAADLPMPATPRHGSVTLQVRPIRANTEVTQGSVSYKDLEVTKEAEDEEGTDAFADDEDDARTCSTRTSGSSPVSREDPASDSNVALSELQGSQHDSAQSPRPRPAEASLQDSDSNNGPLPSYCCRRDGTKEVRRKRLRVQAPTGPARSAGPGPVALKSDSFDNAPSIAQLVAPAEGRGICDTEQKLADDEATDDSNDEDYGDMSDAAASEIRRPPRSRKRVKRAKDMEHNDVEIPLPPLNVSYQATAAASPASMQESEEIPIHGFLTLKTIGSKVVYCLTVSQQLLPEPGRASQSQGIPRSVSSSGDRRDSEPLPVRGLAMSGPVRTRFSSQEDELLLQLKGDGLSWDEISDRFPERSKGTLQVHYSTKLKPRPESRNTRQLRKRG